MSNYKYPDTDDGLVCDLIGKVEPFKGYWEKSEKKVIIEMSKEILKYKKHLDFTEVSLLDAGCGIGRLLGDFEEHFSKIVAIEPDEKRFKEACKNINTTSYQSKVDLRNILIQELNEKEKYDVILCSHILQHVPTEELSNVLHKFKTILKPKGLLLITTCHSQAKNDLYIKGHHTEKGFTEETISKNEFNVLANTVGVLPSHAFSYDSIKTLLIDAGMNVSKINMYHMDKGMAILNPFYMFVERISNITGFRKENLGRDLFVVATNDMELDNDQKKSNMIDTNNYFIDDKVDKTVNLHIEEVVEIDKK